MKKALVVLTLAMLVVSLWTVATRAVAAPLLTPMGENVLLYAGQDMSGQVAIWGIPTPKPNTQYVNYFGVDSRPGDPSEAPGKTAMPFWGHYTWLNDVAFSGTDTATGLDFTGTLNKVSESGQTAFYDIRINFPAVHRDYAARISYQSSTDQFAPIPVWPRFLTPGPSSFAEGYASLPVAVGTDAIDPTGPEARQFPGIFGDWVYNGGIANNFRKHLLGIGVLPASSGDIDFLRSELKASQGQLAGAGGQP